MLVMGSLHPVAAGAEARFDGFRVALRSLPAVGFFPLGGTIESRLDLAGLAIGGSVDLLNWEAGGHRTTALNFSTFGIGVSYERLVDQPDGGLALLRWAYIRAGPHQQWRLPHRDLLLGTGFGYAGLLAAEEGPRTRFLHGLDLSFTVTWVEDAGDAGVVGGADTMRGVRNGVLVVVSVAAMAIGTYVATTSRECHKLAIAEDCDYGPGLGVGLALAGLGAIGFAWTVTTW